MVNPARAGMILPPSLYEFTVNSKPRASGDDPDIIVQRVEVET